MKFNEVVMTFGNCWLGQKIWILTMEIVNCRKWWSSL